jgi:hypothetical protein
MLSVPQNPNPPTDAVADPEWSYRRLQQEALREIDQLKERILDLEWKSGRVFSGVRS